MTFVLPDLSTAPRGGYRVHYEYANRLARRGHRISVVHIGRSKRALVRIVAWALLRRTGLYQPVGWFRLDPALRARYLYKDWPVALPQSDVIVLTGWQTTSVLPLARQRARAIVQLVWDYEAWVTGDTGLRAKIEDAFQQVRVPMVAGSSAVASMLGALGLESTIIRPGVDRGIFRVQVPPHSREPSLGVVLREEPHKGLSTFFAALRLLNERGMHVPVYAVGQWSAPLPEGIHLRDAPTDADMVDFYNSCSVFVLPSEAEGLGLPALEAMACGAAVVCTDNGGIQDIAAPGKNCLLAPAKDGASLAAQIERLLDDPELRSQISEGGQETAAQFDWDQSVGDLLGFLERTLRLRSQG